MQLIVQKKGYRILPLLALALAMAVLVFIARDTQAGHGVGLLELDTAAGVCPDPSGPDPAPATCGDADARFDVSAAPVGGLAPTFDWDNEAQNDSNNDGTGDPTAGVCMRDATTGDVTEVPAASLPAGVLVVACVPDYATPDHTYFSSDKDIADTCGPAACTDSQSGIGKVSGTPWSCVEINNPTPKDEDLNEYAALAQHDPDGVGPEPVHDVLYTGFERGKNNGTAFNGVWLLHNETGCSHTGTGSSLFSGGPHEPGCHPTGTTTCGAQATGDLLLLFNYTGGGKIGDAGVFEWCPSQLSASHGCPAAGQAYPDDPLNPIHGLGTGTSADCSDFLSGTAFDDICAVVNGVHCVTTPWNPADQGLKTDGSDADNCTTGGNGQNEPVLDVNQFFEGGFDLTEAGIDLGCISNVLFETRTSAEVSATLKDYSIGEFDTCGQITVCKTTDPVGATTEFDYTTEGGLDGDAGFTLTDGQCTTFEDLEPGNYDVTETDPTQEDPPFDFVQVVCTDDNGTVGSSTITIDGRHVDIQLGALDAVTCTYTNRQRGSILVRKEDEDLNLLPGACFTFDPDPSDGSSAAIEVCDDGEDTNDQADGSDGLVCIDNVVFGDYDITESQAPPGYEPDGDTETVTVDSPSNCADRLTAEDTPDATFVNKLGTILIHKVSTKAGSPFVDGACFTIDDDAANDLPFSGTVCDDDFDTADFSDTDAADGVICVEDVPLGSYDITETTVPDGYAGDGDTETVVVDDSDSCADKAGTPDAEFQNVPLADIQVNFRDAGSEETSLSVPISCDNTTGTSDTTTATDWDDTLTIEDIETVPSPGTVTITCTIVIDP